MEEAGLQLEPGLSATACAFLALELFYKTNQLQENTQNNVWKGILFLLLFVVVGREHSCAVYQACPLPQCYITYNHIFFKLVANREHGIS